MNPRFQAKNGPFSGRQSTAGAHLRYRWLMRPVVKKVVNFARRLGAYTGNFGEVPRGGTLDRFQCAKVLQERALAGRANAGNLLQPGLTQVFLAAGPVRPDGEAVRLITQPLDEVEHRITRLEHERLAPRHMEGLPPGITVGPLGNTHEGYVSKTKRSERFLRSGELAAPAIDNHEIGPGGVGFLIAFNICQTRVGLLALVWLRYPLPLRERVPER